MSSLTVSSSNFQFILDAFADYAKQTGIDLTRNPFAVHLQSCESPHAILQLLQDRANTFKDYRDGNRKLIDCLSPVVKIIHAFSGVLADAVPFPPAKAVFIGVDVLLAAASGVSTSYDALVDLFECVANFLKRLQVYTEIPLNSIMTDIIVKIMVQVLSVLALATKQIKQGRFKKFAKKLMGESEIEAVLQRLDRLTQEEARMTAAQTLEVVHGLMNNVKVVMDDGKASTNEIRQALVAIQTATIEMNKMKRDQMQKDVRSWLSPPDPSKNHNISRRDHHGGTAAWFTQGDIFEDWKAAGSLLFIHGKPGSGKSILCSAIIQEVKAIYDAGLALMAYYYCDFRDSAKQDMRGLLTSLLGQLCAKSDPCYELLSDLYSRHNAGSQQPDDHALMQCLKDMLELPGQPSTYIIVDGVDECPNTSGVVSPRERVLELVEELVELQLPNLRICITGRPEADVVAALEPLASHNVSLHDESGQKKDISDYVSSVVHSDRRMRKWRVEDKELVIDTLVRMADGMFRWVVCQLESLRHCFPASLRDALHELPETLDETYERVLLEMKPRNREYTHRLLQCLTVAVRPLRVDELAEVLAIRFEAGKPPEYRTGWRLEDSQEAVLSACSSLISIVNVNGPPIVQFSHFSVKEFLTSKRLALAGEILSHYHIVLQSAHTILAQASLCALLRLDDQVDKGSMKNFPLSIYAAQHWVDHARFENVSSSIRELMKCLFDADKPQFATWIWIYDVDHPFMETMFATHPTEAEAVPLYYASLCGFRSLVEDVVCAYPESVNARGGYHTTGLHAALAKGYMDIALLLLEHGADVNTLDNEGLSSLHKASDGGRRDIVEFLLEHNADVDLRNQWGQTPLHQASQKGEPDVARVLLQHGTAVESRDNDGWTPLMSASRHGHLDIVRLLLQNGAAVDSRNNEDWTPLQLASRCGYLDISRLLLDNGADVNSCNTKGWTSLHSLSKYGDLAIVQLLLDHGAAVDVKTQDGHTPLHLASEVGKVRTSRLLIEHGANVNVRDNRGWTPCHLASFNGRLDVVRLLFEHGVDVHMRNGNQHTPLTLASQNGKLEVSRFLIERGADVNTSDYRGWTSLHFASRYGHFDKARLLLDNSADVNAQEVCLWTPLLLASANGHLDVVELLILHGADIDKQNEDKETPLHTAAQNGHLDIAKLLLVSGADLNMRNGKEETPLDGAFEHGKLEIVNFLAEHMGDAGRRDRTGTIPLDSAPKNLHSDVVEGPLGHGESANTPVSEGISLHTASGEGNLDVAWSLLRNGADVNERDAIHQTPLHMASMEGRMEVARLLIQYGADVNSREKEGWTALHFATRYGHLDVAQLLLDQGADMNAKEQDLWTPLHLASNHGHLEVVKLLLGRGVDVHVWNNEGRTPSQVALRWGWREIAKLLLEYGVDGTTM